MRRAPIVAGAAVVAVRSLRAFTGAAHIRFSRCPPSARRGRPRRRRPGACTASSRSTGSRGRRAGVRAGRWRPRRRRRRRRSRPASGLIFTTPFSRSSCTIGVVRRDGESSRRRPVTQAVAAGERPVERLDLARRAAGLRCRTATRWARGRRPGTSRARSGRSGSSDRPRTIRSRRTGSRCRAV